MVGVTGSMRYLILLLLTGCASVDPYFEVSLGYQIDGMSDYWVQTFNPEQCSKNVKFDAELGLELPKNWTVGYHHQSWLLCGGPFNDMPEIYADDIRVTKKFGGK